MTTDTVSRETYERLLRDWATLQSAAENLIVTARAFNEKGLSRAYTIAVGSCEFSTLRERVNAYRRDRDDIPLEVPAWACCGELPNDQEETDDV